MKSPKGESLTSAAAPSALVNRFAVHARAVHTSAQPAHSRHESKVLTKYLRTITVVLFFGSLNRNSINNNARFGRRQRGQLRLHVRLAAPATCMHLKALAHAPAPTFQLESACGNGWAGDVCVFERAKRDARHAIRIIVAKDYSATFIACGINMRVFVTSAHLHLFWFDCQEKLDRH